MNGSEGVNYALMMTVLYMILLVTVTHQISCNMKALCITQVSGL